MKAIVTNAQKALLLALLASSALLTTACGVPGASSGSASSLGVDDSASGAAAGAAGGALANGSSGGTNAFYKMKSDLNPLSIVANLTHPQSAFASSVLCPTYATTGSSCSASGSNMWLSYSDCSFGGKPSWNGVQEISMSSGIATCGTFPNPGASGTLYRQYVSSSGSNSPSSAAVSVSVVSTTIDDSTANLGNFDNQTISTIHNSGYGSAVSFNSSGAKNSVQFAHHISATGSFDHSVVGTLAVSEASGGTQRTLSGSVTVYHNKLRVVGTSTFSNVVHKDICCLPVSGTISTSFAAGANVTATVAGSALIGKSESLQFTGCGTATYTSADGTVSNVSLNRCF